MEWLSRKTSRAYADVGAIRSSYPKFGAGMTLYSAQWHRAQATTCGHCGRRSWQSW